MRHQNSLTEELAEMIEHVHHHHDDEECDDPDCSCHHHHHDHEDGEEHHHHHHHDHEDGEEHHHHHHHDHEEGEEHHHHHHHDHEDGEEHHHHHHDHEDGEEHHHHHHHGHNADEVFQSWGVETHKKFSRDDLNEILAALDSDETYGIVLRAKGIVQSPDGSWLHFDHVPGEIDIRSGCAAVTGRLCVIGSKLKEDEIVKLFGV